MFRSTWTILSCVVLWQYVFQAVVFVLSAVQRTTRTLHGTQYKHHSLKHMLPQYNTAYNDVCLLITSTKV